MPKIWSTIESAFSKLTEDSLYKATVHVLDQTPVKEDFHSWYKEAASSNFVSEELSISQSEVKNAAVDAHHRAPDKVSDTALGNIIDEFSSIRKKINLLLGIIAVVFVSVSGSTFVVNYMTVKSIITSLVSGTSLIVCIVLFALYRFLQWYIEKSETFASRLAEHLSYPPGEIRKNDINSDELIVRWFWNSSLSKPIALNLIIALGCLSLVWPSRYDEIAETLRKTIADLVDASAETVITDQLGNVPSEPAQEYE